MSGRVDIVGHVDESGERGERAREGRAGEVCQ